MAIAASLPPFSTLLHSMNLIIFLKNMFFDDCFRLVRLRLSKGSNSPAGIGEYLLGFDPLDRKKEINTSF